MAHMKTVVHLDADIPGMSRQDLHKAEQAMRDPAYLADLVQTMNEKAKAHAASLGLPDNFTITGEIHQVTHHD